MTPLAKYFRRRSLWLRFLPEWSFRCHQRLLAVLVVFFTVWLAAVLVVFPIVVVGNSMLPTFGSGTLLIFTRPWIKTPHPGDIVCIGDSYGRVVHRIVKADKKGILLIGDNWAISEVRYINPNQILGVAVAYVNISPKNEDAAFQSLQGFLNATTIGGIP